MEELRNLEALGIALLNVIRDGRYHDDLRTTLRVAYDSVEETVCRMQAEVDFHLPDRKR